MSAISYPKKSLCFHSCHIETIFFIFSEYFWLYRLSYLYTGVIGMLTTFVIGYIVSCVFKKDNSALDPHLFIPPLERKIRKLKETMAKEVIIANNTTYLVLILWIFSQVTSSQENLQARSTVEVTIKENTQL